jgi:hypothetical protein
MAHAYYIIIRRQQNLRTFLQLMVVSLFLLFAYSCMCACVYNPEIMQDVERQWQANIGNQMHQLSDPQRDPILFIWVVNPTHAISTTKLACG